LIAGELGKSRLRSSQVAGLQGLADGLESLALAGLGKGSELANGPLCPSEAKAL